jgi:hypothetical protein
MSRLQVLGETRDIARFATEDVVVGMDRLSGFLMLTLLPDAGHLSNFHMAGPWSGECSPSLLVVVIMRLRVIPGRVGG